MLGSVNDKLCDSITLFYQGRYKDNFLDGTKDLKFFKIQKGTTHPEMEFIYYLLRKSEQNLTSSNLYGKFD